MTAGTNGHGPAGTSEAAGTDHVPAAVPDDGRVPLFRSTRLDTVVPEQVRWLWSRRLPLGKLVTLDGDPDVGKSTLCLDLAARVTTGRPLPGDELALVPPSAVVLLAAEDGLDDTIRPRLDVAGADAALVHHFDAVPIFDDDGQIASWVPPTLPEHLPALEALVVATGAVLVIVDVLMAYLSGRADSHRDQDVRRALAPLADLAHRTGACVLMLRHVPKSQRRGGQGISAGSGSIGIIGIARAGMIAASDPDDLAGHRRVLARAKGNLAAPWPSLSYVLRCSTCDEPACEDVSHGPGRVDWLGETALKADQLLAERESDDDRSEADEATDWLRAVLSDGPMPKAEITQLARAEGIGPKSLRTARTRLKLVVDRDDKARGRPSTWRLPDYVPSITCPDPRARNQQPSDQDKQATLTDYVPTLENGHVTGRGEGER